MEPVLALIIGGSLNKDGAGIVGAKITWGFVETEAGSV